VPSIRYTDEVPAAEFLSLGQRVWPGTYGIDEVCLALSKTTNVGAWDGGTLVGSVRVLTDGYFFATIPEILVDQDYRRRGIGRELIRRALLHAPRGRLLLSAQPAAVGFYERIGCTQKLVAFVAEASQLTIVGADAP
jgi:ribosomal protein S18 acetylase RimI-like enzyme